MSKSKIAVLGIGLMGAGMARNLLASGFSVAVFNRNRDKAAALTAQGAVVAASPREAAEGADFIISMVSEDAAAKAVWLGPEGALTGAQRGAIGIDSSTVTVEWIRELAEAASCAGVELLDAPVTGSRIQAAAGELNFLVGGAETTLEKARPVLEAMSKSITHLGPTGSGAMIKLINNFVCGTQVAGIAEGVAMIERSGLDRDQALAVLANGAPGSPLVNLVSQRMVASDFDPHFILRLMAKDLGYAVEAAASESLDLTCARNALALFQRAIEEGHGEKDMSAVVEAARSGSGAMS